MLSKPSAEIIRYIQLLPQKIKISGKRGRTELREKKERDRRKQTKYISRNTNRPINISIDKIGGP